MDQWQRWNVEIFGGQLTHWVLGLGVTVTIILVVALLKPLLVRRLSVLASRTGTSLDDGLVRAVKATKMLLVTLIALYVGSQYLELPEKSAKFLDGAATVAAFLQVGFWLAAILDFWLSRSRERAMATNASAATSLTALSFVAQLLLWTVMLLLALDNLGIDVTALVAGLGIGGVAVALAVQNILGDLFASLSIVVDKPFVNGDFIIVDDYMGTVENVGLKTTRIRSLGGEQIIFSNSDLLKTRVRNYKRMYERRVVFTFGVTYGTKPDQLEKIPTLVKQIVESQQKVRFDRSHFQKFGESSLDFETVYWVLSPDYNAYMDIQQAINLAILRALAQEKVGFAFPTRTLELAGQQSGKPFSVRAEVMSAPPPAGRTESTGV
jgi:small-conductance mechanosensitive channel